MREFGLGTGGSVPAWLVELLKRHMTRESHHKATQRALQLLTMPAAAPHNALDPSASSQQHTLPHQRQVDATSPRPASDSRADAGAEHPWAEVLALQRRLTQAQHPQVCHVPCMCHWQNNSYCSAAVPSSSWKSIFQLEHQVAQICMCQIIRQHSYR